MCRLDFLISNLKADQGEFLLLLLFFLLRERQRERQTDRQRENLTCMNKTLKFFKCQPTHIIWYIQSKYLLVYTTKIPHPGKHYMHKEFQFMLVIMSVQMEFMNMNVEKARDIVKTQGRHCFWYIFSKSLNVITRNVLRGIG